MNDDLDRHPPTIAESMVIDPALLRVLSDPARSFIVYSLIDHAKTVKMLGAEMQCPPTRLYYHVQQLEKHGLIRVERSRLVSGILEKHYRAVARDFPLDRSSLQASSWRKPGSEDLLAFVFDQTRLDISRGIESGRIDLNRPAPTVGSLMAYRNVLKLDPAQATRLYQRLHDFWMEYEAIAKSPASDGQFFAFSVALYPNAVAALPEAESSSKKTRTPKSRKPL